MRFMFKQSIIFFSSFISNNVHRKAAATAAICHFLRHKELTLRDNCRFRVVLILSKYRCNHWTQRTDIGTDTDLIKWIDQ